MNKFFLIYSIIGFFWAVFFAILAPFEKNPKEVVITILLHFFLWPIGGLFFIVEGYKRMGRRDLRNSEKSRRKKSGKSKSKQYKTNGNFHGRCKKCGSYESFASEEMYNGSSESGCQYCDEKKWPKFKLVLDPFGGTKWLVEERKLFYRKWRFFVLPKSYIRSKFARYFIESIDGTRVESIELARFTHTKDAEVFARECKLGKRRY